MIIVMMEAGHRLGARARRIAPERRAVASSALEAEERGASPQVLDVQGGAEVDGHMTMVPAPEGTPLVSVIVVSYECKLPLLACLESLGIEREQHSLEVLLIDNNSRDDTAYEVAQRFPWVQLIVNRKNAGFARAVNEGLRWADGEYVLILNPDTVVSPGTISRAVRELEVRPDVGMLGCKLVRPDGTFDHACKRGFPTISSAFYYFSGLARALPQSPRFAQYTAAHLGVDETGPVDAVNGAFMLVRKSAVADVGQLDERYWLWAEDLDWCHRFWEQGWKVLYWPKVEVVHLKSASVGDHRSLKLNYAFHRSIWLFYLKHHAPRRSVLVSGLVWLGVWLKFVSSTLMNAFRSRRSSEPQKSAKTSPSSRTD